MISDHVEQLKFEGYTIVEGAIGGRRLNAMREAFDELMADRYKRAMSRDIRPRTLKLKPLLAHGADFGDLVDWPGVFEIVRGAIGQDVTLAGGGEGDIRMPRTDPTTVWHTDLEWLPALPYPRQIFMIRCMFLLNDLTEDQGPMCVLPKTHLRDSPPPPCMNADGRPLLEADGVQDIVRLTGAAGSCIINNTEIWHSSTPNNSDTPRLSLQVVYKHAWMRPWEGAGNEIPRQFVDAQTDPRRRQLCGCGPWHRFDGKWDA